MADLDNTRVFLTTKSEIKVTDDVEAGFVNDYLAQLFSNDARLFEFINRYTAVWKADTAYIVGDIRYPTAGYSHKRLECVVAGNSGTTEPVWADVGTLVSDGTVTWIIDDLRDGTPVGRPVFDMLIRPGYVELTGAIYSRAAYPRLWKFATDYGLAVSEADWAAGMYGRFGVGDGSTTFRTPKNAGEFLRALDTLNALDKTNITGDTTSSSKTISNISNTVTLAVGMAVSGSGIPAGATIESIVSSTSITISANATATATGVTLTIAGRRLGSAEVGSIESHDHPRTFFTAGNTKNWVGNQSANADINPNTAYNPGSTGGPETRGHNVAYYGAIKY
ncbi:MAG TPA: hypothetical protein PKA10_10120 [Selenomonadales bacterium]|nr:hypothetical protein [Selenomonadales bacterium]